MVRVLYIEYPEAWVQKLDCFSKARSSGQFDCGVVDFHPQFILHAEEQWLCGIDVRHCSWDTVMLLINNTCNTSNNLYITDVLSVIYAKLKVKTKTKKRKLKQNSNAKLE